MLVRGLGFVGALLGALVVVDGCGRYGSLCAEANECAKGNEADEAACEAQLEGAEDYVELKGCTSEWDEFIACFEEHNVCDTKGERRRLEPGDVCKDEGEKLEDCVKDKKSDSGVAAPPEATTTTGSGGSVPTSPTTGSGGAGGS
jgi:hypothetical protein